MNSTSAPDGRNGDRVPAWVELAGSSSAEADRLLAQLSVQGIDCSRFDDDAGRGLLFFHTVTPDVRNRLAERTRDAQVIAVGMSASPLPRGTALELLSAGASDVVQLGDPVAVARAIAARFRRWAAVDRLIDSAVVRRNLIGDHARWRSFLRRVVDVARFSSLPVLIRGESGTGKELVARLIHTLDAREEKKDLVVLDCTTIVPELSGSEFFGHERGAYTGAAGARDGAFALADGGTLFLDEVGELPLRLQAELLRVVQEGTYKRVGGNTWQKTKFRLVSATHRDLEEEMSDGRFRRDFYYRIAAWSCTLPPLRERREDIPALARHFLHAPPDPSVLELLISRDYPGNIRDLRHLCDRIDYRHVGDGPITLGEVPEEERRAEVFPMTGSLFDEAARAGMLCGMGLKQIANAAADASVRLALQLEEGNVGRAAERLGITDRGLQKRRALWPHR
ncbi:MAG: two-component system, NtrC family, response regulator AtoC [Acidobacteriota bacterium]|nr:two-component system, NtrC family, response regulator AtoC [Acidobacteriota bacterium]